MKILNAFRLIVAAAFALAGNAFATVTYYHNDLVGSPVVATDESGAVVWRESYRPYGERLVNDATSRSNDLWFAGHRQDAGGLVQMGARYYDPVVGRFYSTDPVLFDDGKVHSFNRYTYANNNPVRFVDPDGRTPIDAGFALWDGGKLAGALAAWTVATVNGDLALQSVAVEGMRETRLDAGISVGAIFLPVSSGGIKAVANASKEFVEGIGYARPQLQHALKHAKDFGVVGNPSNKTLAEFSSAIQSHIGSPATRAIDGTYRGQPVTHFVDAQSGVNVIRDSSGNFLSGWKLSPQQLEHVLTTGKLGGG